LRAIIKTHFPTVKAGFYPWSVPQCAGGVIILLDSDEDILKVMAEKINLSTDDYKIVNSEEIGMMMGSLIG
jgi:hypothetical protein